VSTRPIHRRRPQHSDAALLDAAAAVFARHGYAAATVMEIAEAAGTTKPTLYARFGSKAELYEATVAYEAEALQSRMFAAYERAADLSLPDFLRETVDAWFALADDRPNGAALLFGDHAGVQSPVPAQTAEALIQRIAQTVEHYGRTESSGGRAAPLIAAMITGAAIHAIRRCLADPTSFLKASLIGVDRSLLAAVNEPAGNGALPARSSTPAIGSG
jgi:AcrR family transcriptional regulator